MIAPIESLSKKNRPRNFDVSRDDSNDGESATASSPEKIVQTAKDWVGEHPAAAIVCSAALGLLVGWLVKRRE